MNFWIKAIIYFFGFYLLAGFAINIGYHRFLTHRSFTVSRWFQYIVVTLGIPAGTPVQWVGNHRFHHNHTDVEEDPHSPHYLGFWYAHVGWYIPSHNQWVCMLYSIAGPLRTLFDGWNRPRTNQQFNYLAPDVASDPYYRWLSKPLVYFIVCCVHTVIFVGVSYSWMGPNGLWVAWFAYLMIYNLGDSIDSWAHLIGNRPYKESHKAGNSFILGILILGEGWHANHHTFPSSAKHGLLPGQFDWTWQTIKMLSFFGIADNIYLPTQKMVQEKQIVGSGQ